MYSIGHFKDFIIFCFVLNWNILIQKRLEKKKVEYKRKVKWLMEEMT